MFELMKSPARSAAGAIMYVTIGTLMVIWAGLWYEFFLYPVPNPPAWQKFVCVGTILSGIAVGIIGLAFGTIGREAKSADNAVGIAPAGPIAPVIAGGITTAAPVAPIAPVATEVPVVMRSEVSQSALARTSKFA